MTLFLLVGFGVGFTRYVRSRNSSKTIESVAVMPFVNDIGNADLEYLSDGMSERRSKKPRNRDRKRFARGIDVDYLEILSYCTRF